MCTCIRGFQKSDKFDQVAKGPCLYADYRETNCLVAHLHLPDILCAQNPFPMALQHETLALLIKVTHLLKQKSLQP